MMDDEVLVEQPADSGETVSSDASADGSQDSAADAPLAEGQTVTVVLDDSQFSVWRDFARLDASISVLGLLLLAAVLGAVIARFFLEGWR